MELLGADLPAPTRWPLASIGANFAGLSVFATFFGTWLVGGLDASAGQASVAFMLAGAGGVVGGYVGGRLTDRLGPRPVAVCGSLLQVCCTAALLLPWLEVWSACTILIVMTFLQPLRGVAQRIALADAVDDEEREGAFAGYRLVVNVGSLMGPLLGAGLVSVGWWALHVEVVVIYLVSSLFASRLPAHNPQAGDGKPASGGGVPVAPAAEPERRPVAVIFGDWPLYCLMFATTAAWTAVYMYETVLPIALTQNYGLSPSEWGLVYSLGPALIVIFQLRITRWLSGFAPVFRLLWGTALMGVAFLTLIVDASLWAVAVLVVVFVAGDLIWGPASEDAALRMAPDGHRGAYVGVLTSSIWLGSALAPGVGLPLREHAGNTVLWVGTTVIALLSGLGYVVTNRSSRAAVNRAASQTDVAAERMSS
jgi:predicted MFS family arabinose efflux permease